MENSDGDGNYWLRRLTGIRGRACMHDIRPSLENSRRLQKTKKKNVTKLDGNGNYLLQRITGGDMHAPAYDIRSDYTRFHINSSKLKEFQINSCQPEETYHINSYHWTAMHQALGDPD